MLQGVKVLKGELAGLEGMSPLVQTVVENQIVL